jgi:hypothetical protein
MVASPITEAKKINLVLMRSSFQKSQVCGQDIFHQIPGLIAFHLLFLLRRSELQARGEVDTVIFEAVAGVEVKSNRMPF